MKGKFTVVEWLDPTDRDDGWIGKDEAKRLSSVTVVSTYGEIIEESEDFLKLAYNTDPDDATHGTGVITKATIVRRRDYNYPWKAAWKGGKSGKTRVSRADSGHSGSGSGEKAASEPPTEGGSSSSP